MRFKVALKDRQGNTQSLLQVTADATATANDVATALASAGQDELLEQPERRLTLELSREGEKNRALSPDVALAESGLQSGHSITITDESHISNVEQQPGAILRVLSGPDAGIEVPLHYGSSRIGRIRSCDVRLSDPRVSKVHARILVRDSVEIIDDHSVNGVLVGGTKINRATLGPGDTATIGSTTFRVDSLGTQQGVSYVSEYPYLRPPQVKSRPSKTELSLPEVPREPQRRGFPWMALLAPVLMGGIMYAVTQSPMTLVFVLVSPIMMIGGYIGSIVDSRRRRKSDLANFNKGMENAEAEIIKAQEIELLQLLDLHPTVAECVKSAVGRTDHLWVRRPEHPEFLQVRLGAGKIPALNLFKSPSRSGLADLVERQNELIAKYRLLESAPVVADLKSVGGIGISGPEPVLGHVSRGILAQVACLHSPAEVIIGCITSTARKAQWDWLEWLPHTASPHSPIPGPMLASSDSAGRVLLDQLEQLIEQRVGGDQLPELRGPLAEKSDKVAPISPAIVVVVDDASVDIARLAGIAERGPDAGIHLLWVSESTVGVPAACRTFLKLSESAGATVGMVRSERLVKSVSTEALDAATASTVARRLAPVVDASVPVSDDSDLPRMVSVVGLLGQPDAVEAEQILTRWRDSGSIIDRSGTAVPQERSRDLRALVGHTGLEPFTLDLRSQGPHALVGGTTGSGKSEFLQAWVLGMAHAHSPDRVTFLFVDYKGGAAFAKCVDLPHTVGIVTDLSPYLVRRALRSLRAEIRRREHLFNDKGFKDLIDFEKSGDPDCPPSLIIIVDEFAALLGEVPEFIDGVIDVAQRGRSLGLHLVLATQRPAGVIKDSLRANTNLRVALRMNDETDSQDVLGTKDAAAIDPGTPGRGVARVGPTRLIPFQSAFPGARTPEVAPAPPIDVVELEFGAGKGWKIPKPKQQGQGVDKDINRVVDALSEAAKLGGIPKPRRPWLETLSAGYDLMSLNQRSDYEIVLGVVDDPDTQSQHVAHFRPDESGNIVYFGAGGSGKTTALRSLAIAASITPRSGPVHIYGLDFAGGGLSVLEPLVNVGAIIEGDDEERVARLMRMLSRIVDERAARYNKVRASSLMAYRKEQGNDQEPRILVLLDGFQTFRSDYDSGLQRQKIYGQFQQIANEGRAVGVHIAMTADRAMAVPNAIMGAFQHRVVMRQADEDGYMTLSVPKDVLSPSSPPGRCMNALDPNELQLAVLGRDASPPGQAKAIEQLAESVARFQRSRPEPVRRLPETIRVEELPKSVNGLPVLGVEDVSLAPFGFEPQGVLLVAGPPKSGVSSSMGWLAQSLQRTHPAVPRVLLSARGTPLSAMSLWTGQSSGVDRVQEYLQNQIKPYVEREANDGKPGIAVFVEQVAEFAGSMCENVLIEIMKQARRNGHLFVGAGETASFNAFSSSLTELKSSRAGLLLAPETNDGDLLKAQLPRVRSVDFPVGRGYWVRNGEVFKVQLPEVTV